MPIDADYIESLARLVKERLDPQLKAHVEYSNEMWNWTFDQAEWAHQQGQALWGTDVDDAWVQFYGMNAAKMVQIRLTLARAGRSRCIGGQSERRQSCQDARDCAPGRDGFEPASKT